MSFLCAVGSQGEASWLTRFRAVVPLTLLLPIVGTGDSIVWQKSWEEAFARAKAEHKVVLLAVNMDGERANERMAASVYHEPALVELSKSAICLVASASDHGTGAECARFGSIACSDHRRIDSAARQSVLKPDKEGFVVAPQHVLLDPDGKVILSVPYEISADELEWCLATAIVKLDPSFDGKVSASARAPRRLIKGNVLDLSGDPAASGKVPTREETLELIAEVKKGSLAGPERMAALKSILSADEPEAIEYIQSELRRGGGKGAGSDIRAELVHTIGARSPASYWPLVADFLDDGSPILRAEAAVAMEELAAPEATKEIGSLFVKEKSPEIQKELLRALASCGAGDVKIREKVAKIAEKEKDPLLRMNAIVALGRFPVSDPDVAALLERKLREGVGEEREAAACAMALTRDVRWTKLLEEIAAQKSDADLEGTIEAALAVLKEGALRPLEEPLRRIAQDKIRRER
jgi:hypothetical protein